MGTWGVGTFDNDHASDWVCDLEETEGITFLEQSLNPNNTDYLEAPDGEYILAAAEIILAIKDKPRSGLEDEEEAIDWINKNKNIDITKLIPKAISMIELVLSNNSELNELWNENEEDYSEWRADVEDLLSKLKS